MAPRQGLPGIRIFFEPRSVAVAGVSDDPNKLGSIIFANLVKNRQKGLLKASVYALNPAHDRVGEERSYPSIKALPEVPELLVVAVPEAMTPGLMREAGEAGVKAAVIVTSGYAEAGRVEVEKEIGRVAAKHGMRILGPNTIGVLDTRSGVDTLFLRPTKTLPDGSKVVSLLAPLQGEIAIVTQSGHLGETVSEELAANGVGIRALVGTGNQLDVSIEDVIQYFADDVHTKVIVVYLEGLRDGRRFMQIAASASRRKPLVVFKVGKTGVGARAALTHTASLVGDYDVYRAAFRQSGMIEAGSLQELVDHAISLSMLPRTPKNRLVVVTNAGGVGAIAADEAEKLGLKVEPPGPEALKGLRSEFAGSGFIANAGLGNPIDLTASATTDEFVRAVKFVLSLPEYDLALVIPTHQTPGIGPDIAARLGDVVSKSKKPVSMCVIGKADLAGRIHGEFMAMGIPTFPTPERAVRSLAVDVRYAKLRDEARGPPADGKSGRRFGGKGGALPPAKVSELLRSYGLHEPKSVVVRGSKEMGRLKKLKFPVACKLLSMGLLHKMDVGGVAIGVADVPGVESALARFKKLAAGKDIRFDGMLVQEMVKGGVELILGGTRDQTFGPVVMFGLGGTYTELIRDYSLAVAPVTPGEAESMLAQSRLGRILEGYRGGPKVKIGRLSQVVSDFSRIMVENRAIGQMEVNPLIVTKDEILSVDARVIVGPT
ncbi:MAG: acetate--CoA ligase family protein [Thaumarchaeota archaeon]|nr:acetate--CoA ligase family protein [Nitrososphaerota archaeon]